MNNRILVILVCVCGTFSVCAQTPPPGTISRSPGTSQPFTNQSGAVNTFTNASGSTASAEQLAGQLQNLRSVVDQTLPSLSAYTETVSNSVTAGSPTVAGAVSQILSGVLNRNANQNGAASSSRTNLTGILQGLLGTNAPASSPANANTLRDLASLQSQLQSIDTILRRLNVTGTTNSGYGLTPTGR